MNRGPHSCCFSFFPLPRLLLSMVKWRHFARNWWWASGGDRHRTSQKMHEASCIGSQNESKQNLFWFTSPFRIWDYEANISKQECVQALDNPSMRCYPSAGSPGVVNAGNAHLGQDMAFTTRLSDAMESRAVWWCCGIVVLLIWCCIMYSLKQIFNSVVLFRSKHCVIDGLRLFLPFKPQCLFVSSCCDTIGL